MNEFEKQPAHFGARPQTPAVGSEFDSSAMGAERLNLSVPESQTAARPRIVVLGVGGAGGNAVNNMIRANLTGVDFVVANTDAQALQENLAPTKIQLGGTLTEGLGAGTDPETGRAAAEESIDSIIETLDGSHMVFITAGMGGGTGTGAAPEIARELKAHGVLTVGVVTRPFDFEGLKRRHIADQGIERLGGCVDTMIVIPNQHLFRIASDKALFTDAMKMADEVLYNGVRAISDLITGSGTWNLDFADVRTLMTGMGKAMMGTGEAEGEKRAVRAAELAIKNPLLEDMDLKTAKGMLINISAGDDLTFYEVEQAATRVRSEVPLDAAIVVGQCNNPDLNGRLRVSVIATGLEDPYAANLAQRQAALPQSARASDVSDIEDETPRPATVTIVDDRPVDPAPSTIGEPTLAFGQITTTEQGLASTPMHSMAETTVKSTASAPAPAPQMPVSAPVSEQPIVEPASQPARASAIAQTTAPTQESATPQVQASTVPRAPAAVEPEVQPSPSAQPQHLAAARPVAAPPMPRHRDAQAVAEMTPPRVDPRVEPSVEASSPIPAAQASVSSVSQTQVTEPTITPAMAPAAQQVEAQPHVPAPRFDHTQDTSPAPTPATAYEQAVAEARQRAAIEAYEREQAAQQAAAADQARSQHFTAQPQPAVQPTYAPSELPQRPALRPERVVTAQAQEMTAEQQQPALAEADENDAEPGIFGRMRNMVSKAARPNNRSLPSDHGATSTGPHGSGGPGPYDGGPSGPGGGHTASLPQANEFDEANRAMAQHQAAQNHHASQRSATATEHRIQAITSQPLIEDQDDELLMDIPAFLRRQYN